MILQVTNVSKHFGGLQALTRVSFDLPEGQVLGLIGPNGAGKTTLFNVINGVYAPDEGEVFFLGQKVTGRRPYHLAHMGLARTHQVVRPLKDLTVCENAIVGACFGHEHRSLAGASSQADEVLEFVGLAEKRDMLAGSLNIAQKKRLELARALAAHPYLLLLDEVLAGLNLSEIDSMVQTIRKIRTQGITIIMIEHVMKAVMNVSDRILVLNYGQLLADGTPKEVSQDPRVIAAYLGDQSLAKQLARQA